MLLLQGNYREHYQRLKHSKLALSIFLLAGFTTLSMLWSTESGNTYYYVTFYWQWIAIFAIALNVKIGQIPHIITAFIFGMLVSEFLAYGMFFELWEIRGHGKEYLSPFMYHIAYSVFLAFSATILLNRLLSSHYNKNTKIFMSFFLITVLGNLFLNEGRTGQVAFFISIIVTTFIHFRFTIKTLFLSLALLTVVFGSAYTLSNMFQKRVYMAAKDIRQISEGKYTSSLGARVAFYYVAADIVPQDPIIGVGVGDFQKSAKEALQKDDHGFSKKLVEFIPKYHFHNQYLNVLVQNGFIGLFLLLFMLYNMFTAKIDNKEIKELSILFTTIYAVSFWAEPLLIVRYSSILFILFAGLFLGASLHSKETSDKVFKRDVLKSASE